MGLFLNHDYDITRLLSWVFISFSVESKLAIIRGALVDHSLKHFLLLYDFLALAGLTLVGFVNNFSLTTAIITRTLRLRVHTRSKLLHLSDDTTAATCRALLNGTFFAT